MIQTIRVEYLAFFNNLLVYLIKSIYIAQNGFLDNQNFVMIYRIIIEKGEDFGYISHCPAIPGCHSQGSTIEEAVDNIKDAIKGCIEALDKDLLSKTKAQDELYMEVVI